MLYLVYAQYKPGTAPANRALAFFDGLSKLGVKAKVIYFHPDEKESRVNNSYPGIDFEYLWDKRKSKNVLLKDLFYLYNIFLFYKRLQEKDKVYLYAKADIMSLLVRKKGLEVYYELTEHPFVHPPYGKKSKRELSFFLNSCKRLNKLFVISRGLKDFFVENGVAEEKVIIINMTVDPARFANLKKEDGNKYIAFCGTIKNCIDGVDSLIKAFAITARKIDDVDLYIIGDKKNVDDVRVCEEIVKAEGIEKRVFFKGVVSYDKIPQLLKNATVLALDRPDCLQAQFGFPTKLGEYLLTGNPVVVTKVGEIPFYLEDGESAYLANANDDIDFANKLIYVLTHPDEALLVGRSGQKVALDSFNAFKESKKIADSMNLF